MSYLIDKGIVLQLFDGHIMKYVITDLEVLDAIKPDAFGIGACAIPQAISTFAALDLISYLTHPQEIRPVDMRFMELLKNDKYFPGFIQFQSQSIFFDSFRDNLRSIMTHRFSLTKYEITKNNDEHLFIEENGCQIFNTSCFTKMTIAVIKKIYDQIVNDTFFINGYSKEFTMERMKAKIEKLKDFEGNGLAVLNNLPLPPLTTQTTNRLG